MSLAKNPILFLRLATTAERRALLASTLGWMLDGMDVTLYAMVIAELVRELHLSTSEAGLLASLTLIASAAGGILFGILAERQGLSSAFWISGIAFLVAGLLALALPESRSRALA